MAVMVRLEVETALLSLLTNTTGTSVFITITPFNKSGLNSVVITAFDGIMILEALPLLSTQAVAELFPPGVFEESGVPRTP